MVLMTTYTVRAKRWELPTDGIGVTQSRALDTAERALSHFRW
jgi:hypothetical protein